MNLRGDDVLYPLYTMIYNHIIYVGFVFVWLSGHCWDVYNMEYDSHWAHNTLFLRCMCLTSGLLWDRAWLGLIQHAALDATFWPHSLTNTTQNCSHHWVLASGLYSNKYNLVPPKPSLPSCLCSEQYKLTPNILIIHCLWSHAFILTNTSWCNQTTLLSCVLKTVFHKHHGLMSLFWSTHIGVTTYTL